MKKTKICALALSACMALGVLAACDDTNTTTTTSETTTEATTTEATTASSESSEVIQSSEVDAEKIVFSGDEQKNANRFISNFTELYFSDYSRDTATIEQYLNFAHINLKINSNDKIKYETKDGTSFETFTFKDLVLVVGMNFSVPVNEEDLKKLPAPSKDNYGPCYEDGKIWFQAADGESYSSIGIVDYALNTGDGNLTLVFTIYQIKWEVYNDLSTEEMQKYYKLTPEQAAADDTLEKVGTGSAYVGVGQSGSYFLLDYKTQQ